MTDRKRTKSHIKVRYRGECPDCGTTVEAHPVMRPPTKKPTEWVRCRCGKITRCEAVDSKDELWGGHT